MLAASTRTIGHRSGPDPRGRTDPAVRCDALRQVLHELEADILDRIRTLRTPRDTQPIVHAEEAWVECVERDIEAALAERAYATLRRIDEARARLNAGTYGLCRRCGEAIPEERLRVLPFAVLCRACQVREEERAPALQGPRL